MASTDYDVIIGGVKAKTIRSDEGFKRRLVRREIEQQLLSQAEGIVLTSRPDRAAMYQSDWSGGARWWQPLIAGNEVNSYFESHGIDAWSEPGKLVPANAFNETSNTLLHEFITVGLQGQRVYAVGTTNTTNATYYDVYQWTPGSNAFVRETGFHSGIAVATATPRSIVFHNGAFFVLDSQMKVHKWITGTYGGSPIIAAVTVDFATFALPPSAVPFRRGATILSQRGSLLVYDGSRLYNAGDGITGGLYSASIAFNDGLGFDSLEELVVSGSALRIQPSQTKLAISTPEGVYYVKNTQQRGQSQAWVFRVEKDAAGNWIGNPITTLPLGFLALSIQYHLGSVVIAGTPQAAAAMGNDTNFEVVMYHITQGGMGAIGSVLGPRHPDDVPYQLLASRGDFLYFGGQSTIWVWDAVRGGIHRANDGSSQTDGTFQAAASILDSNGDEHLMFIGSNLWVRQEWEDDDLASTNYLTSNLFDGNLPMELKHLTRIEALVDPDSDEEPWEIYLAADSGSFPGTPHLETDGAGVKFAADVTSLSGYHFRYQLKYRPDGSGGRNLRALVAYMTTGEIISEWEMILDGSELLNVDNEVQDEQAFYDALVALMATNGTTTFVDNMQEQERLTDSTATTSVKITELTVSKGKAGESLIHLTVRES